MQKQPQVLHRDGTSQAGRIQKALDPDYVSVDERSVKDLLAFAQKYAAELHYFSEQNEESGDWAGFLGDNDLDEIVAYLNDPEQFQDDPTKLGQFTRPHLTLFLTFLELLQYARTQLNGFTRRHLEFYYREALRLTSQAGIPDRVHVLVELADGQEQFLLPAGTLFQAGQDSQGNDLSYRSDEDLVANQATVASAKSLFADKQVIGIREAAQTPDLLIELFPDNKELLEQGSQSDKSFLAMLLMALGTPNPGDKLPPYPGDPDSYPVDVSLLGTLDVLLNFIPSSLYMSFSTFRSVMGLKQEQEAATGQWNQVNDILESAGKRRDPNFTLDRSEPDNFEKNLLAALGRTEFGDFFNGLPDVEDIYDLYRRRTRDDVVAFIQTSLYMSVDDFTTMMEIVNEIQGRWRQIYEILRAAGKKEQIQHPDHQLQPPMIRTYEADKFTALVQRTLGTISYPKILDKQFTSFDDCYAALETLEGYFYLPAEKYVYARTINAEQQNAQPWEWDQVYTILEDAHGQKMLADRRNALKTTRENQGFDAMILFALGDPNPGNPLPDSRDFLQLDAGNDASYIQESLFLDVSNFTYIVNTQSKGKNATPEEWANVYAILEMAQRRKRNWVETPAEIDKWKNVYVAPDATQVQVQLNAEGGEVTPRWRTFGEGYSTDGETLTTPGDVGFAIASPLLALTEGKRTITLTLAFNEDRFDKDTISQAIQDPSPFRFLLSGEKGMVAVENVKMQVMDAAFELPDAAQPYQHALQITLSLDEQAAPVVPLPAGAGIQTPWPVLRIMLADIPQDAELDTGPIKRYRAFQLLTLEKVHLSVDVDGITKLTLQSDDGVLDSKKPFEPFGSSPVTGSSFYLAHPELCSKKLDEFRLDIDWLGVADNLSTYYLGYKDYDDKSAAPASPIDDNTSFKAHLRLYDNRSYFDMEDIQLFNAGKDPKTGATQTNQVVVDEKTINAGYSNYAADNSLLTPVEVLDWDRYWQMELLDPDFQLSIYARAAAGCSSKTTPFVVNSPYTPKIKHLSVGYSASLEIDLSGNAFESSVDRLYHIEPFGYHDLMGYTKPYPFLPQYDNEGELFIGIKDLTPPQNLSLLFQMAEGSADPDVAPQPIHWWYLNVNQWNSLEEGQLLSDTTNNLLNSGIIKFDLPPVQPGTLLPPDLYWIRVTIATNSRSVADTIAIKAQAVSATFEDHNNAPDHLSQPLPAQSITSLTDAQPEVKAIHQPYSSFGGKSPEQAGSFYTRVSERLRHKDRALTCWDYEHMVLEAFPSIFKVKCLPVGVSSDPRMADVIQVIVIPDIRGKLPFDPFEPKAPADMLLQIQQYLTSHTAPFANFQVRNPSYVQLKVRLGVRLRLGANPGYYQSVLNEELQRYLSPWAYDQSADIAFGGKINTSLIINFVEERPYVDYVAGIKLFTSLDGQHFIPYTPPGEDELGEVSAFAPDVIFVSDRSHQIDLIAEEGYQEEFFTGIDYMKVELDFQVG